MPQQKIRKTWLVKKIPPHFTQEYISKTAKDSGLTENIVKLLVLRGISDVQAINDFLAPSLNQLPRPFLMKGMSEAVEILQDALQSDSPVTVYGDFDADGVTSTTVLSLFLRELGLNSSYYVPDRLNEGYGLNSEAVRSIHEKNLQQWGKPGVLITADCGISDDEVVYEARELGITVIITDHHKPPKKLPQAHAILNPLQPDCPFPCKSLAGVGVAFYLVLGLRSELMKNGHWPEDRIPNLKSYMDLAAIGTVADQVPMTECNRIIVKAGLEILNQRGRKGLIKLLNSTNDYGSEINSEDIAFRIAPRINAIGRIGSAEKAVELLSTNNIDIAKKLSDDLEDANNSRKHIEANIFSDAVQMVSLDILETSNSLVLYNENWHQGVLGIVASRMTDRYHRPVILLTDSTLNDAGGKLDLVKGSGRSIEGIDIHHAVSACEEMLERFGGHEGAVGLTLSKDNIKSFRRKFDEGIAEQTKRGPELPELQIDMETSPRLLTDTVFLSSLSLLAPYGQRNPAPVFCIKDQMLANPRIVGSNHLRFTVMADGKAVNGIGFNLGNHLREAQSGPMDIAFTLRINSFMGQERWEINLIDIRPYEK
jgi:single-stranded-DNA-specific exonuclease